MKTGTFECNFPTRKTRWIVEGYSRKIDRYVYPHQGWSWTEWKTQITDTYETFERAVDAISYGYLKDMIEHQDIVDIRVFEEIVVRQITETRQVNSYAINGQKIDYVEPTYATSVGELAVGDFLILSKGSVLGRVNSIRDGEMIVWVINGGYNLKLRMGDPLTIAPDCYRMEEQAGNVVEVNHIGVPDPTQFRDDYDYQLEFYREHFNTDELTSTLPA